MHRSDKGLSAVRVEAILLSTLVVGLIEIELALRRTSGMCATPQRAISTAIFNDLHLFS